MHLPETTLLTGGQDRSSCWVGMETPHCCLFTVHFCLSEALVQRLRFRKAARLSGLRAQTPGPGAFLAACVKVERPVSLEQISPGHAHSSSPLPAGGYTLALPESV